MRDVIKHKLNEKHLRILDALNGAGEGMFLNFDLIADRSGVERSLVRRNVRHLKRLGLADFAIGLTDEDGRMAGAGYGITREGEAEFRRQQPAISALIAQAQEAPRHGE